MTSRVCERTGKTCYASRSAASKAKGAVHSKLSRNGPALSVYQCRACGLWHIGRQR